MTSLDSSEIERLAGWLDHPGKAPLRESIRAVLRNLLYHAKKGTMTATLEQRHRLEQIVAGFPAEHH